MEEVGTRLRSLMPWLGEEQEEQEECLAERKKN